MGCVMNREDFIETKLMDSGASPDYAGYKYLVKALSMGMENTSVLDKVTTILYPTVARQCGVSAMAVERGIRTLINVMWQRSDPETIRVLMGNYAQLAPGNGRFISVVSRRLQMEYKRRGWDV